jgi:uncharacterized HAD superfamily protein
MRIGVDIDGVIANFVATFIPLVRDRYGVSITEEDIYVHDLFLVLGIGEDESIQLIRDTLSQDLDLYPEARQSLARLARENEVVLLTARPADMMDLTRDWLRRRRVPYHTLVHLDEGFKHRDDTLFDVVIDDHLREVIRFAPSVPLVIIFDHPWNRSLNVRGLFKRASNWREVLDIVAGHQRHGHTPA